MKVLLATLFLLLMACGRNSNEDVVKTNVFYGYLDGTTEVTISKATFSEKRSGMGVYDITQAVVRKSDDVILRQNTTCGEFSVLGTLALTEGEETKRYNLYFGFYESAYIAEDAPKVGHVSDNSHKPYIDTILGTAGNSCL